MPDTIITVGGIQFKKGDIFMSLENQPLRVISHKGNEIIFKRGLWTWIKYQWITFWSGPINLTLFEDPHA